MRPIPLNEGATWQYCIVSMTTLTLWVMKKEIDLTMYDRDRLGWYRIVQTNYVFKLLYLHVFVIDYQGI